MGCWSCLPCTLFVCLTGHTMAVGLATVTPVRSGTRATHAAMVDTPEDWLIETNNARSGEVRACRDGVPRSRVRLAHQEWRV